VSGGARSRVTPPHAAMEKKWRIVTVGVSHIDSRGRSQKPPIPLGTIIARAHMYTYAAKVWDLSIVQGPVSVAPCHTLALRFATFFVAVPPGMMGSSYAASFDRYWQSLGRH
jgi:hypothetical protein